MVHGVTDDWIQRQVDLLNEVMPRGTRWVCEASHRHCPESHHDTLREALREQRLTEEEARDAEIERRLDVTFRKESAA